MKFFHRHRFEFIRGFCLVVNRMGGELAMNLYECACGEQKTEFIP